MSTHTEKFYPGLMDSSVEFFKADPEFMFVTGGQVKPFTELSFQYIQLIKEAIKNDPAARYELEQMHPDSEYKQIEQYAMCNFSGLDFQPDIKEGVLQKGEYWDCPLRDICSGEGKICKPLTYNNNVITPQEIKVIKKLTTKLTNEAIAGDLFLPMGTFHLLKKKIYEKLGIETKQELTVIAIQLNII